MRKCAIPPCQSTNHCESGKTPRSVPRVVLQTALVAAFLLLANSSQAFACLGVDTQPSQTSASATRSSVLCLVNAQRHNRGLTKLQVNGLLRDTASSFAQDMVSEGFFSHVSPSGSTLISRVRRSGYLEGARTWSAAENIGYATTALSTPREIVRSWMGSTGHRRNILDSRFRDVGVGVASGTPYGEGGATFAMDFAQRSS
jgi:uncharacterized protein YkwD